MDETLDVIISGIPMAWDNDDDRQSGLYERFFYNAGTHLNPNGRIYFLAGFLNNLPRMPQLIEQNGMKIMWLDMGCAVNH